jgi:hypothetical protein
VSFVSESNILINHNNLVSVNNAPAEDTATTGDDEAGKIIQMDISIKP